MVDAKEKLETINRTTLWKIIGASIVSNILMLGYGIYDSGRSFENAQSRMFNTPAEKGMVLEKINALPTAEDMYMMKDHVFNPGVHMPKKAKDSVYFTRTEAIEFIKSTAYDTYETKRKLSMLLENQMELKKEMQDFFKAMQYKMDEIKKNQIN